MKENLLIIYSKCPKPNHHATVKLTRDILIKLNAKNLLGGFSLYIFLLHDWFKLLSATSIFHNSQ